MKKIFFLVILLFPFGLMAQEIGYQEDFKAKVIEVIEQKEIEDESGNIIIQQNLKIKVLEGTFKDQEIEVNGVGDLQILSNQKFEPGDKVIASYSKDMDGNDFFMIKDYDRSATLLWLGIIFLLNILIIGRWKGIKSVIALILSFLVILKFIIPQILSGKDPVFISVIGGIIILFFAVYLTQGINRKAHLANLALSISLFFSAILSWVFTKAAHLSGYAGEETIFLMDIGQGKLNLQGLLLAGILIGTLGVLDDVIISQISTVEQIKQANQNFSKKEVYVRSLKVGIDHISSMINTLFFAYASVSLPLLILFTSSDVVGLSFSQAINNEMIATEIVRTFIGSIGIVLSIPVANFIASYYLKVNKI